MDEEKILASRDAEQSVLGSVFYDNTSIKMLADKIHPEDFYYPRHQEIYQTMLNLFDRQTPIDSTTVITDLEDRGKLNECGGAQYIIDLTDAVPTVSNLDTYIELVKDKAIQRKVVAACNEIIHNAQGDVSDSKKFLDDVERKIFNVTSERTTRDLKPVGEMLQEAEEKIQINSTKTQGTVIGLDTGYPELNKDTLGFQNSELIILAARPSMGKTALALNIATNIAKLPSHPYVAFFSLEMGLDQLALRLISSEAMIDQMELKMGHFSVPHAWEKINWACKQLESTNLMFDESGTVKVQELRSICRKRKSEGKLDFVVVDYLQLLSSDSNNDSRVQEVSEISRSLKAMARELQVPVLALSQLSRALEQREDKTPIMADLRESGSIEQDADIVMFIYRPGYYSKDKNDHSAKITIAKNRNGIAGVEFNLLFNPQYTTFQSVSNREESN